MRSCWSTRTLCHSHRKAWLFYMVPYGPKHTRWKGWAVEHYGETPATKATWLRFHHKDWQHVWQEKAYEELHKIYPTFTELHNVQVALMMWWIQHCGSPISIIFIFRPVLFGTPIVHDPLPTLPLIDAPSRSNLIDQLHLIYVKKKLSASLLRK